MTTRYTRRLLPFLLVGAAGCGQKQPATEAAKTGGETGRSPLEQLESAGAKVERREKAGQSSLMVHFKGDKVTDAEIRLLVAVPDVSFVTLDSTAVTGEGIALLSQMKSLRGLGLQGDGVTDVILRRVAGLEQIDTLEIFDTRGTPLGWAELAAMKGLKRLHFVSRRVGDSSMGSVSKLRQVVHLNLSSSGVTDQGLAALAGMGVERLFISPKAQTKVGLGHYMKAIKSPPARLDLGEAPLSGADVEVLAGCGFEELILPRAAKTDLGLKHYLAALKKPIQSVSLLGWNVTDAGLKELHALPDLRQVGLIGTQVTRAGVAALKEKHPGLVSIDDFPDDNPP